MKYLYKVKKPIKTLLKMYVSNKKICNICILYNDWFKSCLKHSVPKKWLSLEESFKASKLIHLLA